MQDVLSADIVGIGGLAKTLVGFAAGVLGTQFVVARPGRPDARRRRRHSSIG